MQKRLRSEIELQAEKRWREEEDRKRRLTQINESMKRGRVDVPSVAHFSRLLYDLDQSLNGNAKVIAPALNNVITWVKAYMHAMLPGEMHKAIQDPYQQQSQELNPLYMRMHRNGLQTPKLSEYMEWLRQFYFGALRAERLTEYALRQNVQNDLHQCRDQLVYDGRRIVQNYNEMLRKIQMGIKS